MKSLKRWLAQKEDWITISHHDFIIIIIAINKMRTESMHGRMDERADGETANLLSIAAVPFYISTIKVQAFLFLCIPDNTNYFLFFIFLKVTTILLGMKYILLFWFSFSND